MVNNKPKSFVTVPLTKGYSTIMDIDDYDRFKKYKMFISIVSPSNTPRAGFCKVGKNGKVKNFYLSREIMNAPEGMTVDHINHNPLDNRKCNLRICFHSDNTKNRTINKNNKTGFKGVFWCKEDKRWRAFIKVNRKTKHIGNFINIKEAARAYNKAAIKYFGEFASLNKI